MSLLRAKAYSAALQVDRWTTPAVNRALKILARGETADATELQSMRDQAFVELVRHSYQYVPYYRRVMDEYSITPQSVTSLVDLPRFPVLTRELARKAGRELRAANIPDSACVMRRSGGTTGEPVAVYVDRLARALETYAARRGQQWMGWKPGMRIVQLFGGSLGLPSRVTLRTYWRDFAMGSFFLPAFELRRSNAGDYLAAISKIGPCVLNGYASALFNLAVYADELKWRSARVQFVFSTAETLPPDWAKLISQVFDCPVKSYYGCGEVNSLGFQMEADGPYWIPDEHVVVESVDPGSASEILVANTLLITNLYNKAQPLIRYINGDMGEVASPGVTRAARHCITTLMGRTSDRFFCEDGSRLSASIGPHLVFKLLLPVRRYQFIQWDINRVEFRYEPAGADLSPLMLGQILDILKNHLGPNLQMVFNRSSEFVLTKSGKHRIMVVQNPALSQQSQ